MSHPCQPSQLRVTLRKPFSLSGVMGQLRIPWSAPAAVAAHTSGQQPWTRAVCWPGSAAGTRQGQLSSASRGRGACDCPSQQSHWQGLEQVMAWAQVKTYCAMKEWRDRRHKEDLKMTRSKSLVSLAYQSKIRKKKHFKRMQGIHKKKIPKQNNYKKTHKTDHEVLFRFYTSKTW